jgi:phosphohistidine phosphatase SixA
MRDVIAAGLVRAWRMSCFAVLVFTSQIAVGDEAQVLVERLGSAKHVLMIRHALAPGSGDPPEFRVGDCSTQRNLNDEGRAQAAAIGAWLKDKGLPEAAVYSSQWCRCLETARLMDIGPVKELSALNSFYELTETRDLNLRALRAFLDALPAGGPPVVLVSHFVTIAAIAGSGLGMGEGALVEIEGAGQYTDRGRYDFGQ